MFGNSVGHGLRHPTPIPPLLPPLPPSPIRPSRSRHCPKAMLIRMITVWRADANNRFGTRLEADANTWVDSMLTWQSDDAPGAFARAASSLEGGSP